MRHLRCLKGKWFQAYHCLVVIALMISHHVFYAKAYRRNTGKELIPYQTDLASGEKGYKGWQSYKEKKDSGLTVQSKTTQTVFYENVRSCVTIIGFFS